MEYSRSELTTVREMIDNAIFFNEDEPIVDFKLLESIFYIIGRHLNVLERRVMIKKAKIKKYKMKVKNTVAITEIKVHKKIGKKTKESTTESMTDKSSSFKTQHKRKSSRHRSRSKSKVSGRYTYEERDEFKKHGRGRDWHHKGSKKHGHYRDDDDEGPRKHGRHRGGDARGHKRRHRDDSQDVLREKILVVSRTSLGGMRDIDHRSAVVTQEQYDNILSEVRRLQDKFGIVSNIDTSWFNLNKPTSLTDPRAALNMAARLEIAHKKLNQMIEIVTKFASEIPGFEVNAAFDENSLRQMFKETPSSKQTPTTESKTSSHATEPEEVLLDEILLDEENLVTWEEFNADVNDIQKNVVDSLSTAASNATEAAKRANKLFKLTAPRLSEAAILNVRFARLRILVDRFTNSATALDMKMGSRMSDCQEVVSQLQFEVETMIERIDDVLAHPAEDPGAVAAIKDDFAIMQGDLSGAKRNQDSLKELHDRSALEFERIRRRLEMIRQVKTTREEALDYLKAKARVDDVNSLLSKNQLYAVVGFLQQKINLTHGVIDSGEVRWQHCIEDYVLYLHERADRLQVVSLHQSLRKYIKNMTTKVNSMLDIVGDFPVNPFKKKLDRDGNCLSCGTPANVKVTEKNIKLAKRLISRSLPIKPHIIEKEETEKPCFPGRPIPHPLDPRALVCNRYCGASISKTESLTSSMGLDVIDKNPTYKSDIQNRVHLTCTPCTHSEETFFK